MRTFIIAEFGMLHDGSFGNACRMVEVARECGADAVKFQTHIAEAETVPNAPMPPFFKGEPRWQYFKRTAFTIDQWKKLKAHCDLHKIEFMSSPFSIEAVELLEKVGMKRYKIPSGEVTNIPFLHHVAKTGKPVILSSGMSNWQELDEAVRAIRKLNKNLTLLQCTSLYPTPPEKIGLNVMQEMAKRYKVPVGLSDQSLSMYACLAAVTLGATIIEKHVTLSRNCYGSDAKHSIEPDEFKKLVDGVRTIEKILQHPVDKNDISAFKEMKHVFEKSIVALQEIPTDTQLTTTLIGVRKPGGGIAPREYTRVLGRRVRKNISAHQLLSERDLK